MCTYDDDYPAPCEGEDDEAYGVVIKCRDCPYWKE